MRLRCCGTRKSVQAVSEERADFGCFAIDPLRGETIAFTVPYVLIEGFYLVRDGSPVKTNADVDQPQNRVTVGIGSAYDLFLTRERKAAQIVRAPTSPAVVQTFLEQNLEVAAGVKQQLEGRREEGERTSVARSTIHGHPEGDGHTEKPGPGGRSGVRCVRRRDEGFRVCRGRTGTAWNRRGVGCANSIVPDWIPPDTA